MADAAMGLERTTDATGYSPIAGTDRGTADRITRSLTSPGESSDGLSTDLASLVRLGAMKLEMGNDTEAEECFRKALQIGDRTVGPDHPDLILVLNDLTRIYLRQSAHAAAEPLLLRLLEMKRSKGEDHPEVGTVLASLATVRQALGRHESAEQLWRRVLEIRERTLAPNHFAIATALEHFGDACAARGKIREALAAFQRAHTIRERTLGGDHASLRISRERIADLQLQASDGSFEPGAGLGSVSPPDRFRLLSGEPLSLSPPSGAVVRDRNPAPGIRKATVVIQGPFSENIPGPFAEHLPEVLSGAGTPTVSNSIQARLSDASEAGNALVVDDVRATDSTALDEAAPYRQALESLREELEAPYRAGGLTDRMAETFALVFASLRKRQVVTGVAVLVVVSLLIVGATISGAGSEVGHTTPVGATLPNTEPVPVATSAAATTTLDPLAATAHAAIIPAPKTAAEHPRATEEKIVPKKATEQKVDTKKVAIPAFSTGAMSRLDSVASYAATSARGIEPITFQPGPTSLGTQRTSFIAAEASGGSQRARLIGDLPSPRVPPDVVDVQGEVRVRFSVDTEGRPIMSTLTVVASPNPRLTTAVKRVIPDIRFEPARTGGADSQVVADVVEIGFKFARPSR